MMKLDALCQWVREREAIRLARAAGKPPPWTADPILGAYRFCNVRREDDAVTRWIAQHIRQPYAEHDLLWFMLAIARWINHPPTLAELIAGEETWPDKLTFSPVGLMCAMNHRQDRGERVYTGAYTINAPPTKGASKNHYVANIVLGQLWARRYPLSRFFDHCASIKAAWECFNSFKGWGPFMSYQVCVDMRFTAYLRNAADRDTWCAAGPGTVRGLNRLHGRPVKGALSQDQARAEIRQLWPLIPVNTGVTLDFSDVPNILCEFDKWMRGHEGGPLRNRYTPPKPAPTIGLAELLTPVGPARPDITYDAGEKDPWA